MSERFDVRRLAAWAALTLLAVVMVRQATDPGPELAMLRAREAQLAHRFDRTCAAHAAELAQAATEADQVAATDPWDAVCQAEELRQVQARIAELEARWW